MPDREPRLRDRGDRVHHLQALLTRHGAKLAEDGSFGLMADRALRSYQRKHDVFPADAIAGPRTMASLDGGRSHHNNAPLASQATAPRALAVAQSTLLAPPRAAASMNLSVDGALFIERHGEQRGVTDTVHHPPGASGVTIGPGYDMRDRSRSDIEDHLPPQQCALPIC